MLSDLLTARKNFNGPSLNPYSNGMLSDERINGMLVNDKLS